MSVEDIESEDGWRYDVVRHRGLREYFIEKDDPQTKILVTEDSRPQFQDGLFLESFKNDDVDPEFRDESSRAPLSRTDFKNILQFLLKALTKSNKERLYAEAGASSIQRFAAKYGASFEDDEGDGYFYVTKEKITELVQHL